MDYTTTQVQLTGALLRAKDAYESLQVEVALHQDRLTKAQEAEADALVDFQEAEAAWLASYADKIVAD